MSTSYLAPAPMTSSASMTPSRPHAFPSRPPLPHRLLSLQHDMPSTPRPPFSTSSMSTPHNPFTSNAPLTPPSSGPMRPGAPRRSHSFCGDSSKSTYALASTNACAHLNADKTQLIAPALERTLSSIGSKGNRSPPSLQMARPSYNVPGLITPPTPPASPEGDCYPFLPQITIQPTSPQHPEEALTAGSHSPSPRPSRPGLSPYQPKNLSVGQGIARPARPSLTPLRNLSGSSYSSSRSSSYTIATPGPSDMPIMRMDEDDTKPLRYGRSGEQSDAEEDDMMEVDGMIERVEYLVVAH